MARTFENKPEDIVKWRRENRATIPQTAKHFEISIATVNRASRLVNDTKTPDEQFREFMEKTREKISEAVREFKRKVPNDPMIAAMEEFLIKTKKENK